MEVKSNKCLVICPNPSMDIQAHIDDFVPRQPTRIKKELFFPGGKGIHVAMALAEMQVPSILLGIWGKQNSETIMNACKQYYPQIEIVGPQVEGFNRSCYSFITDSEWNDTELLGKGPEIESNTYLDIIQYISEVKETLSSVAICGSWPSGASPFSTMHILEFCNENRIPVFIDTTGPQLENVLQSKPYLIHLNRREVCNLFNEDFEISLSEIAQHCEIAAITDGSNGLYMQKGDQLFHANVKLDQKVISTIGCGDCLTAGIMMAHYHGCSMKDKAKMGVAAGAANCIRQDLGMIYKKDVDNLFHLSSAHLA